MVRLGHNRAESFTAASRGIATLTSVMTQLLSSFATAFGHFLRCAALYRRRRRECYDMFQLDDKSLRDIGITKYDIYYELHETSWRQCWRQTSSDVRESVEAS